MKTLKGLIKGLTIGLLIAAIPVVGAACFVLGTNVERKMSDETLIKTVLRVRAVPEYSKIEIWYQYRNAWLGLLKFDALSGKITEVDEPMDGNWEGKRAIKCMGTKFDGRVTEIPLTKNVGK